GGAQSHPRGVGGRETARFVHAIYADRRSIFAAGFVPLREDADEVTRNRWRTIPIVRLFGSHDGNCAPRIQNRNRREPDDSAADLHGPTSDDPYRSRRWRRQVAVLQ